MANQPVTPVTTAQAEACQEPQDKIIGTSPGLYDPEITDTSWTPTEEFKNFLEKHFRRKLAFDQVCDILEEQAVPSVDALQCSNMSLPRTKSSFKSATGN